MRGSAQRMARNVMNRRRYRRIRGTIRCRLAGMEFFGPHIEPVDISFGGLRLYSDEEYAVGALLRLDIFFPRAAAVTFTAEVMWIKASAKGAPARFDVGLTFIGLSPDALKLLQPLLEPACAPAMTPEPSLEVIPPVAESAVDIDLDEEPCTGEPSLVALVPATAGQTRNARPNPSEIPALIAGADHLPCGAARRTGGF